MEAMEAGGEAAKPCGCARRSAVGLASVCGDASVVRLGFCAVGAPAAAAARATRAASAAARLGRRCEAALDGRGEVGEGLRERGQ
jgi:hypothetical protein